MLRLVIPLCVLFWGAPFVVSASALVYDVSGSITQGNGGLVQVGDPWTATLVANDPSADRDNGTNGSYGIRWTGGLSMSGFDFPVFGSYPSGILVNLTSPGAPSISLGVALTNIVVIDGMQLNGFLVGLWDSATSPSLNDDSLMGTLDYATSDAIKGQAVFGFPSSGITQIVGDVRDVNISTVPIPGSLWLLGSALLGLLVAFNVHRSNSSFLATSTTLPPIA